MEKTNLEILLSRLNGRPVPLEVRSLKKSFGSREVLRGVNLKAEPGEVMVLIGGSGSGKTVLLRHMAGLEEADGGEVLVDSLPVSETTARVSLVFQSSALFNSMTVAENVELFAREHGLVKNEAELAEVSEAALSVVGIEGRGSALPSELSGGMKRRVAIARALLTNPDLLLYDEPTTGLDPATKKSVEEIILTIRDKVGITQLVVTHDIQLAFSIAGRLSIMHGGRIAETGTPEEVSSGASPLVSRFLRGDRVEEG